MARYWDFVKDLETVSYFLHFQEIKASPIKAHHPERWVSGQVAVGDVSLSRTRVLFSTFNNKSFAHWSACWIWFLCLIFCFWLYGAGYTVRKDDRKGAKRGRFFPSQISTHVLDESAKALLCNSSCKNKRHLRHNRLGHPNSRTLIFFFFFYELWFNDVSFYCADGKIKGKTFSFPTRPFGNHNPTDLGI